MTETIVGAAERLKAILPSATEPFIRVTLTDERAFPERSWSSRALRDRRPAAEFARGHRRLSDWRIKSGDE
jgi:hypothetical protein